MRIHDTFFFGALFFLVGVLARNIGIRKEILIFTIIVGLIFGILFLFTRSKKALALTALVLLTIPGAVFYTSYELNFQKNQNIEFNKEITFIGRVRNNPLQKTFQESILELQEPYKGSVQIRTPNYPIFKHGEILTFIGEVQKTKGGYGDYLERNKKVAGISYFPKLQKRKEATNSISKTLFTLREKILSAFKQTLPYTESAFLGGITIGSREEFTDEFKDAMSKSGTTHLVALSGYNITILVKVTATILALVLSRKKALFGTIIAIIGFVAMTGAEASVVRAAIMGILASIAPFVGRIYAPRNSIILAALLMALWNPNILAHDVGFQLSFLALIGIVYLKPAIEKLFRIKNAGLLAWKENLTTTASAQIMVTPLLITTFGSVSAASLISNLLILELIPFTMFLGFILAAVHLISYNLSLIIAWITLIPLKVELGIIKLFSIITIPISTNLTAITITIYYLFLAGIIYRLTKFKPIQT
ncbi:hypothetical protein CL629_00180 [bacterium]|nr:hypothetical protein [bacterium]|tara:strand:+ start:2567 stop:4000 length:1434 start_codon:yes stop_codon:yes gene_type:complete